MARLLYAIEQMLDAASDDANAPHLLCRLAAAAGCTAGELADALIRYRAWMDRCRRPLRAAPMSRADL